MRRFTILGLMGLVLGVAVAIAALRNADDYWAGGMMLATALLIGVVALSAVYHSGRRRAGRLGFAVFAGGYFALFLGLSEANSRLLPTTWPLVYVHERVTAPLTTTTYTVINEGIQPTGWVLTTNVMGNPRTKTRTSTTTSLVTVAGSTNAGSSARWKSLIPGAANFDAFQIVGHCLFTLLVGLVGAVIALRFHAGQERASDDGQETPA